MSWLNLNESLNSIKGQISNFASNVLADENEGVGGSNIEVEELKKLCGQQEIEIRKLKAVNEELRAVQNGDETNAPENYQERISNLRLQIRELEDEKIDLVAQLEQLDNDNAQNVNELVASKEKIKEEYMELKEKFGILKQQNIMVASREEKLKKQLEEMKKSVTENGNSNIELIETKKELSVLKSTNETCQKILEEMKIANEEESKELCDKIKRLEGENKIIYSELQKSKEEIKKYEAKTIDDEENCQKLVRLFETYEENVKILKAELEKAAQDNLNKDNDIKKLKIELEKRTNSNNCVTEVENNIMDENKKLKEEINNLSKTIDNNLLEFENLKDNYNKVVLEKDNIHSELEEIKKQKLNIQNEFENYKNRSSEEHDKIINENNELKIKLDEIQKENSNLNEHIQKNNDNNEKIIKLQKEIEDIHKTYINIISENVKKYYVESDLNPSEEITISTKLPEYTEFNTHVENILKILLDFKLKCELLETDVCDLQEEKNKILTEKNIEIEKLIQNSELLSQEVISKTETLREYEKECNELIKNNEILISQLEEYKNNSGLQTISESNEDNMILLESQLEQAIKRIKELETMGSSNNLNKSVDSSVDYHSLLNDFDKIHVDYEINKKEIENLKIENEELKTMLEKFKSDYENTEYQLEEVNVNLESLKEDIENYKKQISDLLEENKKLRVFSKNDEDLRTELNNFKEKLILEEDRRKNMELTVKDLMENLQTSQKNEVELRDKCNGLHKELTTLRESKMDIEAKLILENDAKAKLQQKINVYQQESEKLRKNVNDLEVQLKSFESDRNSEANSESDKNKLEFEITNLHADLDCSNEKIKTLENQVKELNNSRNELIQMVNTKHQESITYHTEIQRLSQLLQSEISKSNILEEKLKNIEVVAQNNEDLVKKSEEIEKLTDQNTFLREKCDILTKNLLDEQSKNQKLLSEKNEPSEKEITLAKNLERLQAHLIEEQEHYTQELLQAEQKNVELQAKVNEIEVREKNSSTMYTSVSIRANQQVEVLQNQLQMSLSERDELRQKISDAEDASKKQAVALANLQFVLEQFRKDKEKDVAKETERIRRQITVEKKIQDDLRSEISNLKIQLDESKQGLLAASRLSDQLEISRKQCSGLKEEVQQLQTKLQKSEENLKKLASQTDGKVDKSLVKNLVTGYVTSNSKDQQQILKIIATVLDFNQQDHDKVGLNKTHQTSWLSSILGQQNAQNSQSMSQESLSQAFVRFLENESKPRVVPSLLNAEQSGGSSKSSPRQSPIVLSEIVLPTFADFGQNRNSSSILKDVLKDNS